MFDPLKVPTDKLMALCLRCHNNCHRGHNTLAFADPITVLDLAAEISIREAVRITGISQRTIYRMIEQTGGYGMAGLREHSARRALAQRKSQL